MVGGMTVSIAQAHIKRATRDLVRSVGGTSEGAVLCRVRQQDLSDYQNRDQPARFMPADVIRDLEAVAPRPLVTEALAIEAGYSLFKLPVADVVAGGDWPRMLAAFGKESGELVAKVATHAMDVLTAREVRDSGLISEIDETIAVLVAMRACAVTVAEGQ
jgi:hypothetical protein